jgi:hypothetical protein
LEDSVRRLGLVAKAALAVALCCGVARAGFMPSAPRFDLGSELMLRLFGETSDSNAAFAAAHGDRTGESPLHELALQAAPSRERAAYATIAETETPWLTGSSTLPASLDLSSAAAALDAGLARSGVHFAPPAQPRDDVVTLIPSSALLTATYQPVAPTPNISPAPGTLAFGRPSVTAPQLFEPAASTRVPSFVPVAAQVAGAKFEGRLEGASTDTPQISLHDNTYGAGANFDVRAGKRDLTLNLSTQYERVSRNDFNAFTTSPLSSTSSWQLPNADAPLMVPSYADLNRFSVGAGLAVPVVRGVTLNLNYDTQRLYGGFGLPGLVNLDTINNSYGGRLTFNSPDASKSLSISAYQERFSDSVLPINGYTQTREDVNFTVKF